MTCELVPVELTDEQKSQVYGVLSVGCDRQTAADYLGCSLGDIRRAMQRDATFAAGVCRAEARIELSHMRNVHEVATDNKEWRASVWWLERRSPERFGRRSPGAVTPRQLKEFIAILADALREVAPSADDGQQIVARLNSLAESVDKLLRDSQLNATSSTTASDPSSPDALVGELCDLPVDDWNDADVES